MEKDNEITLTKNEYRIYSAGMVATGMGIGTVTSAIPLLIYGLAKKDKRVIAWGSSFLVIGLFTIFTSTIVTPIAAKKFR